MGIQYCVKQDVKPYAFLTLRRFPLLLKSQVEQELHRMEHPESRYTNGVVCRDGGQE